MCYSYSKQLINSFALIAWEACPQIVELHCSTTPCASTWSSNAHLFGSRFVCRDFHATFWLWACSVTPQFDDFAGNELLQEIVIA
ncbi:hypothetical protein GBAR_LOCUS6368 [Geodia barretti]|uniref:Uncharacterized protein n=1 Tax=Geodia barretti TaxID=519541 RepID=A0AA35RG54_GEOBA|nr:hypothetical protein GBAR_LOCUS6368 [Geodia barretti]